MYPPDKLNIHPGDNHVARRRLRSFWIPSYNCVQQRNNVQFCRVPAMVPPERHQTPDWRSLPSSHQWSRREDGAVFQAVTEEVQAAATTSTTGIPDAVSPYSTQPPVKPVHQDGFQLQSPEFMALEHSPSRFIPEDHYGNVTWNNFNLATELPRIPTPVSSPVNNPHQLTVFQNNQRLRPCHHLPK